MKKIMFNDRYGLTHAVLDGRKTMTRRIVPKHILDKVEEYQREYFYGTLDAISVEDAILNMVVAERMFGQVPKIGEIMAVAQSLQDMGYNPDDRSNGNIYGLCKSIAWANKMFVSASQCIHQIQITDIHVERLQDITDDDCLKEGVWIDSHREILSDDIYTVDVMGKHYCQWHFTSPREAFAALIDKVSGNGTWVSNPYVFAYSFQLLK